MRRPEELRTRKRVSRKGDGMKRREGMTNRLAGIGVVAVALVAVAIAGRAPASQATVEDGDVVLGAQAPAGCTPGVTANCETETTGIFDTRTNGDTAFAAIASTSGTGVFGHSPTGDGVQGSTGLPGTSGSGSGVHGEALNNDGVGVRADGPRTGLEVNGAAVFSRSGRLTIPAGHSEGRVKPLRLTASSIVLATIQGNVVGLDVRGVTIVTGNKGSFTIHLNKDAPSALVVGWFVVN
jgi:hypothetical protein